jgi:hypothetical protein
MPSHALAALLTLLTTASSAPPAEEPAVAARTPDSVQLSQRFVAEGDRFLMLGDGLAASIETGRMRWLMGRRDAAAESAQSVVTIEPVGARPSAAPVGEQRLVGVISRFHGPPSEWRTGQATFAAVRYVELWDGIDLLLEAEGSTLKGTYEVAPGADPGAVRLRHEGADAVTIDAQGRLIVSTPAGELVDAAPEAWQHIDGERHDVSAHFVTESEADGAVTVSFALGTFDPSEPLLIDPAVIVQAGFLGGAFADSARSMAVDDAGFLYIGGNTASDETTFPVVTGPGLTLSGWPGSSDIDAFVAKLDPTGETLIYAGYIGGLDQDVLYGLAVDSLGRATVCGVTQSDENSFPVINGPDSDYSSSFDGWVARVSADGTSLEFCGYVGGNSDDQCYAVAVDDSFRTYLVGRFKSLPNTLPLAVGPSLTPPGGPTDAFVGRLSANGAGFEYCGYVGGDSYDDLLGVAADAQGGLWFCGWTGSTDFPTVGPLGPSKIGSGDLVVGRVAPDGQSLTASGYIGSVGDSDFPQWGLSLDPDGAPIFGAETRDALTFPIVNSPSPVPSGDTDGVVIKIAPDGQSIAWTAFTNTGDTATARAGDDGTVWWCSNEDVVIGSDSDPVLGRISGDGTEFESLGTIAPGGDTFLYTPLPVPSALTPGVQEVWLLGWSTADETLFPVVSGPDVTANGSTDTVVLRVQVADDPWTDLGLGKPGTHGTPILSGAGTMGPLSPLVLTLENALENTTAWLAVGFATVNVPFKGGTFIPDISFPGFLAPVPTDALGEAVLSDTTPSGSPPGFSFYAQYWVQDAGAAGAPMSASNGLQGTTP